MTDIAAMSMEQLAAYLANYLRKHKIDVVVVGGFAVSCYTHNRYLTGDIDMVDISYQNPKTLAGVMTG